MILYNSTLNAVQEYINRWTAVYNDIVQENIKFCTAVHKIPLQQHTIIQQLGFP